jgi:ABC-type dipeptide/oligopeptide/nickel transport system permease subunit
MNEVSDRQSGAARSATAGIVLLLGLWALSFSTTAIWPAALHHCPFGRDALRPDQTVCELAIGGLWVSLGIGIAAGALSTLVGLALAMAARAMGGVLEAGSLRFADAFFALPDVLVLMVLQFAAQTLGDVDPRLKVAPVPLMIFSLAAVGWSGPARMIRNRLATLEAQDFIAASKALGASRPHLLRRHLWPAMRPYVLAILVARIPAAILAESTVSFFGIAKVEPISLGRYLGTSYASLLYPSGARIVLPAWILLVLVVLGAALTTRAAPEKG